MKEIHIKSMSSLIRHLNSFPNHFIFRGLANATWFLESSIERYFPHSGKSGELTKFERYALDKFKSKFHLYDSENITPESDLEWLALMQHYGVPTRLLDFTVSPYNALYFALEAYNFRLKNDFAIVAIDYRALMKCSLSDKNLATVLQSQGGSCSTTQIELITENFGNLPAVDVAVVAEPKRINKRLDRQLGTFLFSLNQANSLENILNKDVYSRCKVQKIIIPGTFCNNTFALLRKMGITSRGLYGDLSGLSAEIRMEFQVYS